MSLAAFAPAAGAGSWSLTFSAPTHTPKAGKPWTVRVGAHTTGGRALRASLRYEFYWHGLLVAKRGPHRFTGTFRQTLRWPKRAVGRALVLRAVVRTRLGTKHADYWVKVRK